MKQLRKIFNCIYKTDDICEEIAEDVETRPLP